MISHLPSGLDMVDVPAKVVQLAYAVICPLTVVGQYWVACRVSSFFPHSLFASSIIQVLLSAPDLGSSVRIAANKRN